ncbi:hypothetical protein [Acidovorax sp.]|uniref:hypothetical protein n=1 Tax=Acidovorax sp. TaxID=1872122 RepID=UPI00391F7EF8
MSHSSDSHEESAATAESQGINHHFKREGQLMIWLVVGLPIVLVLAALFLGPAVLALIDK